MKASSTYRLMARLRFVGSMPDHRLEATLHTLRVRKDSLNPDLYGIAAPQAIAGEPPANAENLSR
jgi:hypothetical protein